VRVQTCPAAAAGAAVILLPPGGLLRVIRHFHAVRV